MFRNLLYTLSARAPAPRVLVVFWHPLPPVTTRSVAGVFFPCCSYFASVILPAACFCRENRRRAWPCEPQFRRTLTPASRARRACCREGFSGATFVGLATNRGRRGFTANDRCVGVNMKRGGKRFFDQPGHRFKKIFSRKKIACVSSLFFIGKEYKNIYFA